MRLSREQSKSLARWMRAHHPRSADAVEVGATVEEFANLVKCGVAPEDECIEWGAGLGKGGYGIINIKKADGRWTVVWAHRAVREIIEGPASLEVLHECGNKPCFSPGHTRYGTRSENVEDMYRLGETGNFGEGSHLSKLTQAQVNDIRTRYVRGWSRSNRGNGAELRAEYGISPATLSRIVNGVAWVRN